MVVGFAWRIHRPSGQKRTRQICSGTAFLAYHLAGGMVLQSALCHNFQITKYFHRLVFHADYIDVVFLQFHLLYDRQLCIHLIQLL